MAALITPPDAKPPFFVRRRCKANIDLAVCSIQLRPMFALCLEIETGNLVRRGRTIEIYDYDNGQYQDVDVESVQRISGAVVVEVFAPETGENRTFEMDER